MSTTHLRGAFLKSLILILFAAPVLASTPGESNPRFFSKNLTRSAHYYEVNPRFAKNGDYVLFLVFTGDPEAPTPWDYVLTKSDREGHVANYLSTRGVLDYTVLTNDDGVLVLKAAPSLPASGWQETAYEGITEWELWYINLTEGEEILLEASMGLPLSEGYRMLGLVDLPDTELDQLLSISPKRSAYLQVRLEREADLWFFSYYLFDEVSREKKIFTTECWQSYSDVQWWPQILWIDETTFLTIGFTSIPDEDFPQKEGLFSIVEVDLAANSRQVIYAARDIRPFPKFVINTTATVLYFQKQQQNLTELWRLNLLNGSAEAIYSVNGELGEVRLSADESSLVFTQLSKNNCDIIRLDMERTRIAR